MMTHFEIADLVMAQPHITHGFIQHTVGLSRRKGPRNSGGGFQTQNNLDNNYRVVLWTDKAFAEEVDTEELVAVRRAFAKLGLSLPKELK